ncbi:MAG TPA: DUF4166 domain-containing protein [Gaiellaceae bacterium]
MTSIFRRALGDDFDRLHPEIQRRFGFSSADGVASIGHGVMEELWRGPAFTLPFLVLGTWRRIMFPERGHDVPFRIENYAYVDRFGRETVTWARTFELPRRMRMFDATMIWSERRGCIVDYLGTHQHLAVDLHASVDEEGGIRFRSGEQRFYERRIAFRFPLLFSGIAEVREWYDDAERRFRISVEVGNERFGRLFGYRGWFQAEERPCAPHEVPARVKPVREERRE